MFSKQDLIDANIPLDITIEELIKEYRHGGLTMLPRASLCNTIKKTHPEIITLSDLFELSPQSKCYMDFQKGILQMATQLRAIHEANAPKTIPFAPNFKTLEEGLRQFLPDYLLEKRRRAFKVIDANERYCKVLEMYLDENSSDTSRGKIADELKMKRQNVDIKLSMAREEFKKLFIDGKELEGISVDPGLINSVKLFQAQFRAPGTLTTFIKYSRINSPRMQDLLCLILGYKILETGVVQKVGVNAKDLGLNVGRVKKILKKEGIPVSFEDFRFLLKKEISDRNLRQELDQFVRENHEFEILQKNNREFIAVKWEYLNDLDTELIRILYDKDAWGPANALSKEELKTEWERRAKLAGRKNIKYTPCYRQWRFCPTSDGHVMLKWTKDYKFIPGQKYVSALVSDHPNWTFDDVVKQADLDGYTNLYSKRSLRTYWTNVKEDTRVKDALDDAVRVLDNIKGKTMAFPNLYASLNTLGTPNGITESSFRKWVIINNKVFQYFFISGQKGRYVKLIDKRASLITTTRLMRKVTGSQKISIPKRNPAPLPVIDWTSIHAFIDIQVPEIKSFSALSNSVDKIFIIIKKGGVNLSYNSIFNGWLPDLVQSNTMPSWTKDGFRRRMLLSVEAYLDNFYLIKTGGDLKNDIISDPYYDGKPIGLMKKMNHLSSMGFFPDGRITYSLGSIELTMIRAKKTVVDGRNSMGHTQNTVNLADSIMSAQIHDTLLLFAYFASQV